MLTAAVIRDKRVRSRFSTIAWLNMSQEPNLLELQQTLYMQLSNNKTMPTRATTSVDAQLRELAQICESRVVCIVLDDMWDCKHEQPFDCMDMETSSKLLVTTRIKGIIAEAEEFELELLGLVVGNAILTQITI